MKSGSLNQLELSGPVQVCTGMGVPFSKNMIIGCKMVNQNLDRTHWRDFVNTVEKLRVT
jgi:hypothetical protein